MQMQNIWRERYRDRKSGTPKHRRRCIRIYKGALRCHGPWGILNRHQGDRMGWRDSEAKRQRNGRTGAERHGDQKVREVEKSKTERQRGGDRDRES